MLIVVFLKSEGSVLMFCPVCGSEVGDGVQLCPICGYQIPQDSQQKTQEPPVQPVQVYYDPSEKHVIATQIKEDRSTPALGAGIASMVFGIFAILTFCVAPVSVFCAVISVFFGVIANVVASIKHKKNGFAVAGVTCSLIVLLAYGAFLVFGVSVTEFLN